MCRWRVLLRRWMAGSPNPGRRDLVARGIAARHDEHSRALVSQLLVGRAVQRSLLDRQLRQRARCRAMGCACAASHPFRRTTCFRHSDDRRRGGVRDPDHPRQGVGSTPLARISEALGESACYCIPYAHRVQVYARIGFNVIEPARSPRFLKERLDGYQARGDGRQYLLMHKPGIA